MLSIIVNMITAPAMAYSRIADGASREDCEAQCDMF
ncbi:hypothetical protein A7W94_05135 [Salmonella enterica subsp. enterica serovar Saintpaul]|nr:hypothetical protein A7W94_05135 [Salmonella enterica subsp. enterica serovar Saintpaul]